MNELDLNFSLPDSAIDIDIDNTVNNLDLDLKNFAIIEGVQPTGTLYLTENGQEDCSMYQYVDVDVPTGPAKDESDITVSGPTITVPAGLYSQQAQKSVASGEAGEPIATKGTVRNNQVSITPSVENETGYISGGTKTGDEVIVKASDLVSGTLNVTENGEKDVTNYQKVNVNVSGGSGKNIQVNASMKSVRATSLASSGLSLTCNKSGTYKISWAAARSSSSGTMSTRLYVNSSAKDTDKTTWTNTYGQQISVANYSLKAGDVVEIYARSGNTSRYCMVMNLIIEEQ